MPNLHIVPQSQLSEKWFYQIISFQRAVWTEGFVKENLYRNWITRESDQPISIFLGHEDILISHAQVVSRNIHHQGQQYIFYGITGVFTYQAFRKLGYGKQVIGEAMKYIATQADRDIVLFSCEEKNAGFYEKCGWQFNDIPILEGDPNQPRLTKYRVAMEFISEKAKAFKNDFLTKPFFFGDELW